MTDKDARGGRVAQMDDRLGELIKAAGRREAPDPTEMARARAAARAEWLEVTDRRPARKRWALAGAAVLASVIGVSFIAVSGSPPWGGRPTLGTLQAASGAVIVRNASGDSIEGRENTPVYEGDRLETTSTGRAVLVLAGSRIVLDRSSSAALDGTPGLTLHRGAVYVDAGRDSQDTAFRVATPFGVVRHLGTQFVVDLRRAALLVHVREGSVSVEQGASRWIAQAGEALTIGAGLPERQPIAADGPEWAWIADPVQPFVLEGATLARFLDWAARQQGWRWTYADPAMRARFDRVILHGTVEGLTVPEALDAVLPACGLTVRRAGDLLTVHPLSTK